MAEDDIEPGDPGTMQDPAALRPGTVAGTGAGAPGGAVSIDTLSCDLGEISRNADRAAAFLGGLASPHRLRILCQLSDGEKSVSQLIAATGLPQTSMSQHLAKLKEEGIVSFRREHRTLYYAISNPTAVGIMNVLRGQYCG